nr:hypothetical protein [Tanacetum cinerariifolium]
MESIEKRYGGNKEFKKVQRTLLKQQYKNFAASSSEPLDQTFDRLRKLISLLKIQDIETISLDDLYNNIKIYEPKLTRSSSTSQNLQNVAFVSSNNTNRTSSTNEVDNTTFGVRTAHSQGNIVNSTSVDNLSDAVICAFLASQSNSPQLAREDLEQIDSDDLEEKNLHWEMAMLTIRARSDVKTVESKHKSVDVKNKGVYSNVETKHVRKNIFSPPIFEDWNSNDESKVEFKPKVEVKTVRASIEKIKFVKTAREKVEKIETPKQNKQPICFQKRIFTNHKALQQVKDIKEKDKIRAKTRQNQEQTGSIEKSKVKPDKVKA